MGCFTRTLLIFALLCLLALLLFLGYSRVTRSAGSAPAAPLMDVARPAPVLASSDIRGRPSLSVFFINRVLAFYHSSAAGLGQAMYQDSLRYHIDDAYALAFFFHESSFGTTGVARFTHSVGNIICTAGWLVCVGRFRWYPSWAAGCLDWFRLLASEYLPRGLTTLATIVPVYAPSSDGNDVSGYIAAVIGAVNAWRAGRVEVTG